jgi:hypothetical protein
MNKTELLSRLAESIKRISGMCSELRPPRMSIPVRDEDDDIFIIGALQDAINALSALPPKPQITREMAMRLLDALCGKHGDWLSIIDVLFAIANAPAPEEAEAQAVAWYKGHTSPGTVHGPAEYDVECYYGDEPPGSEAGWLPLYAAPPSTRALSEAEERREFERAYQEVRGLECQVDEHLSRNSDGSYFHDEVDNRWYWWLARARAQGG